MTPRASVPRTFETAFATYARRSEVGSGGAGRVFECVDSAGKQWAIKVLDPTQSSTDKLQRFKNEYSFCLRHPHPNVVSVVDHGFALIDGTKTPFFVMPYYVSSLRKIMDQSIAPDEALRLFAQVLDGVEAAHKLDVVHRDLKPENILYSAADRRLVVADFGIAHFATDLLATFVETAPAKRLANFQYAAPEQRAKGGSTDARADIYALGLILNELFTGHVPHGTNYQTIAAVAAKHAYLDDLVSQMLRQAPSDRPASLGVVKAELIARGVAFVQQQEFDKLRNQVVPTSQVSDPLVDDPIRVVGAEWGDDVLTIRLSGIVNEAWIWAFQHMGSHSSTMRQPPEAFRFRGNTAHVQARHDDAQAAIDYFKSWLPRVHAVYEDRVRRDKQRAEDEARAALAAKVAAAELKASTNRALRI